MGCHAAGHPSQPHEDDAEVAAAIEQVLDLHEIAIQVFGEAEGVVRAGEGGLQVAQNRIDAQERRMLDGRRAAASDVRFVQDARTVNGSEAAQTVRDQGGRCGQRLGREALNRLLGERTRGQADCA